MSKPLEPRRVESTAWKRWFSQGWQLARRKPILWLLYALVASMLSALSTAAFVFMPANPILQVLVYTVLFPLAGNFLFALGQLIAARADDYLSAEDYWNLTLGSSPLAFTVRMVLRKPDRVTIILFASYVILLFLMNPLQNLPLPDPDFRTLGDAAMSVLSATAFLGAGIGFIGLWTVATLTIRATTDPQIFLHHTLLGLSWNQAEYLAVANLKRNSVPLERFRRTCTWLFAGVCLVLLASFLLASPILAGAFFVVSLLVLNLVACSLYVAWRDIFLGRRENAPVESPAPAAHPVPVP